jgi:putative transposase
MAAVCRALHVARSTGYLRPRPRKGRFYRRAEDTEVLYQILSVTKTRASYGYRRTHRLVNREREAGGETPYNRKRIRRVMRIAGLMLPGKKRHCFDRPHTGKVEMPISNQRWCSDGFNVPCWNGDVVRVAFALDCHDREALGHVARARDLCGEDIRLLLDEPFGPDSENALSRLPSRSSGSRTMAAPTPRRTPSSTHGPSVSGR